MKRARCVGESWAGAMGRWAGAQGGNAWGMRHGVCGMGCAAWGVRHGVCGMGCAAWGVRRSTKCSTSLPLHYP